MFEGKIIDINQGPWYPDDSVANISVRVEPLHALMREGSVTERERIATELYIAHASELTQKHPNWSLRLLDSEWIKNHPYLVRLIISQTEVDKRKLALSLPEIPNVITKAKTLIEKIADGKHLRLVK